MVHMYAWAVVLQWTEPAQMEHNYNNMRLHMYVHCLLFTKVHLYCYVYIQSGSVQSNVSPVQFADGTGTVRGVGLVGPFRE